MRTWGFKWMGAGMAVAIVLGCAAHRPTMYEPTNNDLLRAVNLEVGQTVAAIPALASAKKVVVASLERPDVRDFPVQAAIDDAIIEALGVAGIRCLERDPDILVRLAYSEGTPRLEYLTLRHLGASATDSGTGHTAITAHTFDSENAFHVVPTSIDGRRLSELAAADIFVAYRILECGVQYRNLPPDNSAASKMIERHALTRLHIRVIDVKSGQIIWSRTLEATRKDQVPSDALEPLQSPSRSFYSSSLPLYGASQNAGQATR